MASSPWRVPTGPIRRPVAASPAQPRYQGTGAAALTPQDLVLRLRFVFTGSDLFYAPWCLQAADLIEEMLTVPESLAAPAEQSHQHHQGQEPTCTPPQPGALDSPTHPPTQE